MVANAPLDPVDALATPGESADLATDKTWGLSGRAIANAAVVLLLTRIATVVVAGLLEVLLVRLLTGTEWDAMSRFLTLISVFTIAQFGLPESVLYFATKAGSLRSGLRLTARTSALLGGCGALLGLPFFIFPELTERLLGPDRSNILVPLIAFAATDLAFSPLPSFLLAHRKPKLASALSIGTRIPIAVSVIVAAASGFGVHGALVGMAVMSLLSLVCGWGVVLYVARGGLLDTDKRISLREQVVFSVPVGLTRLVQIANVKLDKYIVMTVFAESAFGSYYLGATEFPIPGFICTAVMTVMMTDLIRAAGEPQPTQLLKLWHASIEKIAIVVLPVFTFLFAFADPIFSALYGGAHASAAPQFRIFSLLLLARVTNYTYLSIALGKPRVPLIAAGLALGLNAGLSVIFVQEVGLLGPAIANVVAVFLSTIYTMHAIRSELNVPWRDVFPLRRYARTLGLAVACTVPATGLLALELPPIVTVVAGGALVITLYVRLAGFMGMITADDIDFLKSVLRLHFLRAERTTDSTATGR